jgi:glycosyltransferase involved in cell wall biosynthesis
MRILQVIPFFTPEMGGSAEVAYQITKHISERGHEVTVVTSDYRKNFSSFPKGNFEVVFIPNLIAKFGFYLNPDLIQWARANVPNYDLIHMHTVRTFQNAVVRYFANKFDRPYILSAHGTLPLIVQRQFFKKVFDRLIGKSILESARYLIAVSPFEAEQYQQAGVDARRIRIIYNGLNLDEFSNLPQPGTFRKMIPGKDGHSRVILCLGRLHRLKGINFLIKALMQLQTTSERILLAIVGPDDGELRNLQALTKSHNLQDRVWFAGPLYGREKLAAMQDADVLVSPSFYEIFGLVPFEALMCGTPVIVAEDSGMGQLIRDAEAGYLTPYGNAQALAEALQHVFLHPDEAEQKVESGKRFIQEHLSWGENISELETLYQQCLH